MSRNSPPAFAGHAGAQNDYILLTLCLGAFVATYYFHLPLRL